MYCVPDDKFEKVCVPLVAISVHSSSFILNLYPAIPLFALPFAASASAVDAVNFIVLAVVSIVTSKSTGGSLSILSINNVFSVLV